MEAPKNQLSDEEMMGHLNDASTLEKFFTAKGWSPLRAYTAMQLLMREIEEMAKGNKEQEQEVVQVVKS